MRKFRRLNTFLLCVIVLMTISVCHVSATEYGDNEIKDNFSNAPYYGDTNTDGYINIKDLIRLKKYLADVPDTIIDEEAANISKSGTVGTADLVLLRKILLNII